MRDGLRLIQVPGAYYGYSVTRVGWLRRVDGDEFELLNAVTVWRSNGQRNPAGVDLLAAKGLGKDYSATEPATQPEELHRLTIRRSIRADEKAWARTCPRPKGWEEK